jgi:hypothetical protein
MPTINHPSKDVVRAYMKRRARDQQPPPAPQEIRRQLGWAVMQPDYKEGSKRS